MGVLALEKVGWLHVEKLGQPFNGPKGQVALSSLDCGVVGPMNPEHVAGKGFLGQPSLGTEGAEVEAQDSLKIALHAADTRVLLLIGLHTNE